jgi:hypothetical protein
MEEYISKEPGDTGHSTKQDQRLEKKVEVGRRKAMTRDSC